MRDGPVGIGENYGETGKSRSGAYWCAQHRRIDQTQSHQK